MKAKWARMERFFTSTICAWFVILVGRILFSESLQYITVENAILVDFREGFWIDKMIVQKVSDHGVKSKKNNWMDHNEPKSSSHWVQNRICVIEDVSARFFVIILKLMSFTAHLNESLAVNHNIFYWKWPGLKNVDYIYIIFSLTLVKRVYWQ